MCEILQEKVTHLLLSRAMGSIFSFFPKLYRGNQEPADLACVFGNFVFLFYCTDISRSFEKAFNHNSYQARRWLKKWDSGMPLKGSNAAFDFNIDKKNTSVIFCVSITRSFPGISPKFLGLEYENGATIVLIALPEDDFKLLMDFGCSPVDFVNFTTYMAQTQNFGVAPSANDFIVRTKSTIDLPFKHLLTTLSDARYVSSRLAMGKFNARLSPEMKKDGGLTTAYELGIKAICWLSNVHAGMKQAIDAVPLGVHGPNAGSANITLEDNEIFIAIGRTIGDWQQVIQAPSGDHPMLIARIAATRSTAIFRALSDKEKMTMIVGTPITNMPQLDMAIKELGRLSMPIRWNA